MNNKWIKLLATVVLLTSAGAFADETYVCKHANKERLISITYEKQASQLPCKVTYQKDGLTSELWSAKNVRGYCAKKAESLVAKQTGWGWACNKTADKAVKQ
ncbi:MAG: hypothetical protein ISEC1_P1358 [Thiomicrorhabdus sp.]|nr:MAG: hypothetical protein ISEC1_P1358 [Thiomicrorhabdus sp.]